MIDITDDHSEQERVNIPVPMPESLARDFMMKCKSVAYTVQCLECSLLIQSPASLRHHIRETNSQHIVSSLTDSSLVCIHFLFQFFS